MGQFFHLIVLLKFAEGLHTLSLKKSSGKQPK